MERKKFRELTENMTDDEFRNMNPFLKKNCSDCVHLKPAISLWCTNDLAIKARGTRIPGVSNCPYWKPNFDYIDDKYKTVENGFVEKRFNLKGWFVGLFKN